jgi:predicted O-methyltransferase YrrM
VEEEGRGNIKMIDTSEEHNFIAGLKNKPYQVTEELAQFIKYIKPLNLNYALEIGAGFGGTTEAISHFTSHLISIDSGEPRFDVLEINKRCGFRYLQGDSHYDEAHKAVEEILEGNKLDMLFIDGDHSYAGAKLDFLQFRDMIAPGGIIAFHDIVDSEHHRAKKCNVFVLWRELKKLYEYTEIITDGKWGGIGIIKKGL